MERALHIHNDRALSETEQRQKGDRKPAGKEHFLEVERKSLHAVRAELVGDLRLVVWEGPASIRAGSTNISRDEHPGSFVSVL